MTTKYKHFQDGGHSWYAVPLRELASLGVDQQISAYSYILGATVYLEEDCDAAIWFSAVQERGEAPAFENIYHDNSPIREYPRYRAYRGLPATLAHNQYVTQLGA